jgi:hypothetical protein
MIHELPPESEIKPKSQSPLREMPKGIPKLKPKNPLLRKAWNWLTQEQQQSLPSNKADIPDPRSRPKGTKDPMEVPGTKMQNLPEVNF